MEADDQGDACVEIGRIEGILATFEMLDPLKSYEYELNMWNFRPPRDRAKLTEAFEV